MENSTQTIESPEPKKTKAHEPFNVGWYFFIGFMFAGMGIGKLTDYTGAGTLIGMALGFVALAIYMLITRKKDKE